MDGEQPTRVVGHTIEVDEFDAALAPANGIEESLTAKLAAEEARLWRLLPTPPAGHHWEMEQQRFDEPWNPVLKFRVVAYLKED
ncbi:hypothetical protein SEA_NEFERTHENA_43 [Microbacterium phage Neferthena]|uniref:Uncharacterized protein n=1 Tax=Microbacterium phage Neferthena TaxID=2301539 RepID=A0A385D3M5_9CAUD|nr:hypothetical protein HOT92_gp59 [Microbacterium phage Neferthena]AXQ52906.1 hypothetical protein SEA_NEFERTHENA_43 [Microbacterium phage Neferthena]